MRASPTDMLSSEEMGLHVPAIELQNISKSFGTVQALKEVSFVIPQGQVVALLGPNGAGKTTAISLMLGLRHPSHGQVRLLGREPHDRRARSRCGVMLQESGPSQPGGDLCAEKRDHLAG
jgi:ABC-2 type transport system ATP-binding protein